MIDVLADVAERERQHRQEQVVRDVDDARDPGRRAARRSRPPGTSRGMPANTISRSMPSQPSGIEYRRSEPYSDECRSGCRGSTRRWIPIRTPSSVGEQRSEPDEQHGRRQPPRDRGGRRARGPERDAEVSRERGLTQVRQVLLRERLVEPVELARCSAMSARSGARCGPAGRYGSPGITRNRKKLNVSTNRSVTKAWKILPRQVPPRSHRSLPVQADRAVGLRLPRRAPRRRRNSTTVTAMPPITTSHSQPGTPDEPVAPRGTSRPGARR